MNSFKALAGVIGNTISGVFAGSSIDFLEELLDLLENPERFLRLFDSLCFIIWVC
jgi:hypothetical protein